MPRSRTRRDNVDIWPGFVDALSTLLMVIIFLLAVFMLGQFFLTQALEGRDEEVEELENTLNLAERMLEEERATSASLVQDVDRLSADVDQLTGEQGRLQEALESTRQARLELSQDLALSREETEALESRLQAERDRLSEEARRAAQAEVELATSEEALAEREQEVAAQIQELVTLRSEIESLASVRDTLEAEVADLNSTMLAQLDAQNQLQGDLETEAQARVDAELRSRLLESQLGTLSGQLVVLDDALGEKQAEIDAQSEVIADLGLRLNEALSDKVEELSQFRSDFLGRLRGVLSERDDVEIVGDRFVFQSEVLFAVGDAEIGAAGREQLATLAQSLIEISSNFPDELPWVLQVDGHTDKQPITSGRYPSNWELSAARAISVARFLISQGLPAERIAARGFAEFQPIDPGDSPDAFRRNRRIELKLTTR